MVADNVRSHYVKLLKKWLLRNQKLEVIYLPLYPLNLIPQKGLVVYEKEENLQPLSLYT